jgi:hypothetical protein
MPQHVIKAGILAVLRNFIRCYMRQIKGVGICGISASQRSREVNSKWAFVLPGHIAGACGSRALRHWGFLLNCGTNVDVRAIDQI